MHESLVDIHEPSVELVRGVLRNQNSPPHQKQSAKLLSNPAPPVCTSHS
ncbi:MAG: hypothetical protein LBU18_07250 [Treponema sp.]|nr:hypothetical protein [Treponema sp.]